MTGLSPRWQVDEVGVWVSVGGRIDKEQRAALVVLGTVYDMN
jgi:hypothetical protein